MASNVCAHCDWLFPATCEHCPQCGNADYYSAESRRSEPTIVPIERPVPDATVSRGRGRPKRREYEAPVSRAPIEF